jgi:molybdopterin molybdotransferase
MSKERMGYDEALKVTLESISPLASELVDLTACSDRIVSENLYSKVCSPSVDSSMKDGYAVKSDEIQSATPQSQVCLKVIDMATAGRPARSAVIRGTAVRILTGAQIPEGANAVLSEEFTKRKDEILWIFNNAQPGRNILPKGADVETGELIVAKGSCLSPARIGILAAGGYSALPVYRRPKLAIFATGDELVVPGDPLPEGKLYASIIDHRCERCPVILPLKHSL